MKQNVKKTLIITSIITALPILIGVFYWDQLPDTMATHFSSDGTPNGWSSKLFSVFGLPLFLVAINALCTLTTETDPRRSKYPEKMMKIIYWICPAVSWICAIGIYGNSLGFEMGNILQYLSLLMGVLFIVIGNYLPKVKQNYYLGIKLPWTYTDENNWNKTHRFGGKVFVVGGILFILNFFLKIPGIEIWLILAMVLIPAIYSYAYSRKKDKIQKE